MENKESNWKGTKGEWVITQQPFITAFNLDITAMGLKSIPNKEMEANAQLIADAGNVRQQIDCSLPELLERYKRMEEALKGVDRLYSDVERMVDGEVREMLNEVRQALNTNTNK